MVLQSELEGRAAPSTQMSAMRSLFIVGHGDMDIMNGNGLCSAHGEPHGTYRDVISGGSSNMDLWLQSAVDSLFICFCGWGVMESVCACCCPSGRTESLLQVIIIIFYRSS